MFGVRGGRGAGWDVGCGVARTGGGLPGAWRKASAARHDARGQEHPPEAAAWIIVLSRILAAGTWLAEAWALPQPMFGTGFPCRPLTLPPLPSPQRHRALAAEAGQHGVALAQALQVCAHAKASLDDAGVAQQPGQQVAELALP